MSALSVGVTTAKYPECKRGLATNIAAAVARHGALSDRVCLVDADPLTLDVSTRLAVSGPVLEDFARATPPSIGQLGRLGSPSLTVVPSGGASIGRTRLGAERALPALREAFDVVVCDLPGGPSGPGRVVGGRLEHLDWLVLAVTPERTAVATAAHFLELFETARTRGDVGEARLAVVVTGDESCSDLDDRDVSASLEVAVAARIPQLWGRATPNLGFGAALAIPELDEAVYDLFMAFRLGHEYRDTLVTL